MLLIMEYLACSKLTPNHPPLSGFFCIRISCAPPAHISHRTTPFEMSL
nr:MAG TPA: hypothetical protein [Caudoviricetes sp.]